ncbi:MAG TPA: hypothetical protein VH063_16510 [Gaiellaceae bacterium]|jgi:hypothetical protein|nr:hypothetical protein [Gaiellaceae bacterium]
MRRRTIQIFAFSLLSVLVIAAAGCGSKKTESTTTTTTTEAAATTTTTAATTTPETTTSAATTTPASLGSLEACQPLVTLGESFAAAVSGSGGDPSKEAAALQEAAAKAPSAIRGDITTIASAYAKIVAAEKGFTPGTTPSADQIAKLAQLSSQIQTPEITKAEQDLEAWAAKNCHS